MSDSTKQLQKSVQQIIATAVKHNALEVELDLSKQIIHAKFNLPDGICTTVDIDADPAALLAELFKTSQILERGKYLTKAICRVEFKAVSVDFQLRFNGKQNANEKTYGIDRIEDKRVSLSNFLTDVPEHPCFWLAITESSASAIRRIFERGPGILLVAGSSLASRKLAFQALQEAYPQAQVVDSLSDGKENSNILAKAQNSMLIVGIDSIDVFTVLKDLEPLEVSQRVSIRGIVGFYKVPRLCLCCDEPYPLDKGRIFIIKDYVDVSAANSRHGHGCDVCSKTGSVGFVGIASVLDMSGPVGRKFREGCTYSEILTCLADSQYESLYENGLRLMARGAVAIETVMNNVRTPPAEYLTAIRESRSRRVSDALVDRQLPSTDFFAAQALPGTDKLDFANGRAENQESAFREPVRGKAVFAGEGGGKFVEEDELFSGMLLSEEEATRDSDRSHKTHLVNGEIVLVIDDDADQRAIIRRVLEIAGYKVEVAADGIDGIVCANKVHPHLIIVDFMMPDLDGKETIRRLRKLPNVAKTPIVALTAYANPEVEYGLLDAGADDFCSKSISKKVLLKRVERLMKGS